MDWFLYDNGLRHERVKIKCMHDMTPETQTRKSNDVTGGNKINYMLRNINPLSAKPTKWSNTLKQFVGFCLKSYVNI